MAAIKQGFTVEEVKAWTDRAQNMSDDQLTFARKDCWEAGQAAWDMEKSGYCVSKSQGWYLDEAMIYAAELKRRRYKVRE